MARIIKPDEADAIFDTIRASSTGKLDICVRKISQQKNLPVEVVLAQARDKHGLTILHKAAAHGATNILEYYDSHFTSQPTLRKSLMNERNIMRDTPIHIAARYDQYYFVKALHERKIDVSTPGAFGFTALHYAARETHTELVRDLAVMGANLNAQSLSGDTALHLAAYNDDLETVTELLRLGASASVRNASDSTPGVVARNIGDDSAVYKYFKESNRPH